MIAAIVVGIVVVGIFVREAARIRRRENAWRRALPPDGIDR